MSFLKRWLIEGTLTTYTPLRIGDGGTTKRLRLKNKQTGKPVQIASVATDMSERTHIPASTLKSRVKVWTKDCGMSPRIIEILLGSDDPEDKKPPNGQIIKAVAGKVEFDNAPAIERKDFEHAPPHWCEERWTGVEAAVTINRRTRAARDERLFHQEYVPPGVTYKVVLRVRDAEKKDAGDKDDDEGITGESGIVQLLAAMEGFNVRPHGVTLGSASGDGWGIFDWKLDSIKYIDCDGIKTWLEGAPTNWREGLTELKKAEFDDIRVNAQREAQTLARNLCTGSVPTLDVQLACQDDFLVNDPTRTKALMDKAEDAPNHAPLRDVDGNAILPRRSARGAFRAQAEKILRTIGGEKAACQADDPQSLCQRKAIKEIAQVAGLCLACQVFGAPGWRSPFRISAFVAAPPDNAKSFAQTRDFVAIDRFTQGVAAALKEVSLEDEAETREESAGMKFNAGVVHRPVLTGSIGIDLAALERAKIGNWAIGLLALTFRDLIEGDIRIGFGRGKGFGEIAARVTAIAPLAFNDVPASFQSGLTAADIASVNPSLTREALRAAKVGEFLTSAVEDLHRVIEQMNGGVTNEATEESEA